jgi:hypothetical protein
MIDAVGEKRIDRALAGLLALDVALAATAFLAPDLWFRLFHGVAYDDPEGLLRRCGANWAGFALFQAVALRRWKARPYWLFVVAGMRLSDVFTDWTYLAFARETTWLARVSLSVTSPANVVVGVFFLVRGRRAMVEVSRPSS